MRRVHLKRFAYAPAATLGRLTLDDHTWYTVERPWLGNKPFVSCIPQGFYHCRRYSSAKYPDTWEVCGVPERSQILFHVANWPRDVQGCIGLGMEPMGDTFGVARSRVAVGEFLRLLRDEDEFELMISQYMPEYP